LASFCITWFCFDLSDLANVALTLGIIFFVIDYRRRTRELGHSAYVSTATAYIDLEKEMIENKSLRAIYDYSETYRKLPDDAKSRQHYFYALLMIFEIVFLSRKWLSAAEWEGWTALMTELMQHSSEFRMAVDDDEKLYARPLVEFLRKQAA